MATALDPGGAELALLLEHVRFADTRVLELGTGDGRLTFRYQHAARSVVGIDPDMALVGRANAQRPGEHGQRLQFLPACALRLPFRDRAFDIALLAWSL